MPQGRQTAGVMNSPQCLSHFSKRCGCYPAHGDAVEQWAPYSRVMTCGELRAPMNKRERQSGRVGRNRTSVQGVIIRFQSSFKAVGVADDIAPVLTILRWPLPHQHVPANFGIYSFSFGQAHQQSTSADAVGSELYPIAGRPFLPFDFPSDGFFKSPKGGSPTPWPNK